MKQAATKAASKIIGNSAAKLLATLLPSVVSGWDVDGWIVEFWTVGGWVVSGWVVYCWVVSGWVVCSSGLSMGSELQFSVEQQLAHAPLFIKHQTVLM